nr:MAG TPA: protein of unknown function (DUF4969) [Caudoviricetes sp.]
MKKHDIYFLSLIVFVAALSLSGCRSKEQLVREEAVALNNTSKDSVRQMASSIRDVMQRDSIVFVLGAAGDTVKQIEKHYSHTNEVTHDTLYIVKSDTVKVPVKVRTKEVVHKTPAIVKWCAIGLAVLSVISFARLLIKKRSN